MWEYFFLPHLFSFAVFFCFLFVSFPLFAAWWFFKFSMSCQVDHLQQLISNSLKEFFFNQSHSMPEWKVYRPSLISLQHLKWVISVSNLPLHLSLTSERMSCTRNRMFPITQWGESHAAALAHMFASSCKALPSRNRFLAQFWTPIDVLPGNNGPKSVLIPKVVSIGSFKINFAFLHSVWVMLGDKACSQRWEKTERGCCCQNRPFGLPQVFQQHRENGANSLCGSVGRTVSCVTLHLPSQEGLYVCCVFVCAY